MAYAIIYTYYANHDKLTGKVLIINARDGDFAKWAIMEETKVVFSVEGCPSVLCSKGFAIAFLHPGTNRFLY